MNISEIPNERLFAMSVTEITDQFSLQEITDRIDGLSKDEHQLRRLLVHAARDWKDRATQTITELMGTSLDSLQAELASDVSENRKHCIRMAIAGIKSQLQTA
jgi:hypothetical protein